MKKKNLNKQQEKLEEKIFNFIAYKDRSWHEVNERLEKYLSRYRSLSARDKTTVKNSILDKISALKLVDDMKFAQSLVEEKIKSKKPFSKMQVRKFLYKKGIHQKIIENSLEKFSREIEMKKAKKDAMRKSKTYKDKDKRIRTNKLKQYLLRKGYPYEIVYPVVDSLTDVK